MKNIWFFLMCGLILLFLGCSNDKPIPKDLIPEDTLIQVIVELHLADAILIEPSVQQKQIVINKMQFYKAVLNNHSLTREGFQINLDYYSENPEQFDQIYEKVIEKLTVLQGNLISTDSLKVKPLK